MQSGIEHLNEDIGTELAPSGRLHAAGLFVIVAMGVALVDPELATLRSLAGVVVLGLAAAVVFAWTAARAESRVEGRGLVLAVLMLLQLGFWLAFTRVEQLLRTVAELDSSGRELELWIVTPLLVLAPAAVGLWALLERAKLEPTPAAKFAIGYVSLAVACTFLAAGIEWSIGTGLACMAALTIAALCVGPAAIASLVEHEPRPQRSAGVVAWLLLYLFARSLGGWIQAPSLANAAAFDACLTIGFGAIATAVLSAFMWRGLDRLGARRPGQSLGQGSGGTGLGELVVLPRSSRFSMNR